MDDSKKRIDDLRNDINKLSRRIDALNTEINKVGGHYHELAGKIYAVQSKLDQVLRLARAS